VKSLARLAETIGGAEIASLVILTICLAVPFVTDDPMVYSVSNQALIAVIAAFSVYLMLRMNLLTFAVPAFMALGGYAVALAALAGVTDVFALIVLSFVVPAVVALPLGALVLRLRGVYFVLVTFVLTEILQLVLFETPRLTGGANGLAGIPATTVFGVALGDNRSVLLLATVLAVVSAGITTVVTRRFRQHFAAIEENEILAQSLGLVVWRYKALGFVVAAGLAGLAGFSLVNMLLTAHPTSFSGGAAVNYIAYTIVGGRTSILGPMVGSVLLVWASNIFGGQGEYSQGLFGVLIIVVVLVAKGGIVGTVGSLVRRLLPARRPAGALSVTPRQASGDTTHDAIG
jgi:ABC-type branched-subunit amino acid transport system permease subunit